MCNKQNKRFIYIGLTQRIFQIRLSEHSKSDKKSDHQNKTKHNINFTSPDSDSPKRLFYLLHIVNKMDFKILALVFHFVLQSFLCRHLSLSLVLQ